jgi:hypothetical protein
MNTNKLFCGTAYLFSIFVVFFLAGCSDYKPISITQKMKMDSCLNELNNYIVYSKNSIASDSNPASNELRHLDIDELAEFTRALVDVKSALNIATTRGEILLSGFTCPVDRISNEYQSKRYKLVNKDTDIGEELDKMNKEIDDAINDVMDEYKQKAVKHSVLTGPGPRVDMFIMKNGTVVYCKTTITNAGKAVDCH